MAYSVPHHASNAGNGATASVTITSPTAGNLLLAWTFGPANAAFGVATGWTKQIASNSGTEGQTANYKISDGTETSFSMALNVSGIWSCFYMEIAGWAGTPTLDQWSFADSSTTSQTSGNVFASGNGTCNSNVTFTTTQPTEAAGMANAFDPPEFGEYAWIDGVRIRIVGGGHSGGKSAGSFTNAANYTTVDTNTSQVNAAGISGWESIATVSSGNISNGSVVTYSVSGPTAGDVLTFYGLVSQLNSVQVINAAIKRASTF